MSKLIVMTTSDNHGLQSNPIVLLRSKILLLDTLLETDRSEASLKRPSVSLSVCGVSKICSTLSSVYGPLSKTTDFRLSVGHHTHCHSENGHVLRMYLNWKGY